MSLAYLQEAQFLKNSSSSILVIKYVHKSFNSLERLAVREIPTCISTSSYKSTGNLKSNIVVVDLHRGSDIAENSAI
jgi:hypothetical protein